MKQLESERGGNKPVNSALTTEQQEIQELEVPINRLKREKDIKKKATALLISEEINRTR